MDALARNIRMRNLHFGAILFPLVIIVLLGSIPGPLLAGGRFLILLCVAQIGLAGWQIGYAWANIRNLRSALPTLKNPSPEDRLDELERLKRRDMVTSEEYAAKRQEILEDL
jgi:hypothetical protein